MKKIFYTLILISTFVPTTMSLEAAVATAPFDMPIDCRDCGFRGGIFLRSYLGMMSGSFEKTVNLENKKTPGQNLSQSFQLEKFGDVDLKISPTTGAWINTGGQYDTPPMDGIYYVGTDASSVYETNNKYYQFQSFYQMKVDRPVDRGTVSLISGNSQIVSCSGTGNAASCFGRNVGTTTITVRFNNNNSLGTSTLFYKNPVGFGSTAADAKFMEYYKQIIPSAGYTGTNLSNYETEAQIVTKMTNNNMLFSRTLVSEPGPRSIGYSFSDVVYTVTVTPQNIKQTSVCTGTSNVSADSATVNWSYSDPENDPQTQYVVQLSRKAYTDPDFDTSTDIAFVGSGTGTSTSHTFTGLASNTTYYSRVKTYNAINGQTAYSSCSLGFTTGIAGPQSCSCNGTRNLTCTNPTIPVVINSPACALDAVCSVATTTLTTTYTITPIRGLGTITYTHSPSITATQNNTNPYSYSTAYSNTNQSLLVDLFDSVGSNSKSVSCQIDNTPAAPLAAPSIDVAKSPAITMNKGGQCTISWDIKNMPTGVGCQLSGGTTPIDISLQNDGSSIDSRAIGPINQNTRFTLTCSGGSPSVSLSKSTICRINPNINEI